MIAILLSAKAGKGKAIHIAEWLKRELSGLELDFDCYQDAWPQDLETYTDVWLVGGDGTLNFFINKYPNLQIPISIFKGGSGNDFAWKLFGDKTLDEQFEIATGNNLQRIDAGICNGKYFFNGIGIGFDGAVVQAMGKQRFISASHLAYLFTVFKKIFSYTHLHVKIVSENLNWIGASFMITIANGSRFGGGFVVAPGANITDGLFDLIILPKIPKLKRFYYLPKVEKGKHLTLAVCQQKVRAITIESGEVMVAHADGELMCDKKFSIEILPERFLFRS